MLSKGEDLHLRLTFGDVVHGLQTRKGRQQLTLADAKGAGNLPGRPVADPRVEHLARMDQIIEGAQRLFHRRLGIEIVNEVDVEVIGLQSPKTDVDLLVNVTP